MKNQVKSNLEEQDNYTTKYLCDKCKDVTYILKLMIKQFLVLVKK